MEEIRYKHNRIINLLFALSTGFLCVSPLNNSMLNYLFRIPASLVIMILVIQVYDKVQKKCSFALLTLALVFLIHFINDTPINFDIFLATLSLFLYLFLIIISENIHLNRNNLQFINKCSILSALVLIVYSVSPIARLASYENVVFVGPYLTYGFDNSNYAGSLTFLIFSMLFITKNTMGPNVKKLCYLLCVVLLYLIYETNSRTALASAVFVSLTEVLFFKRKMPQWIMAILCIIPFIFVPFYLNLGLSGSADDSEFMGKSIMSGRVMVYENFLGTLNETYYWIFGNLVENRLRNAHNGPLAILSSCGIVGVLSYFYVYFSKLFDANQGVANITNKIAVFVLLACFLNTTSEAAMLLGGFPMLTHLFMFSILSFSR